MIDFLIEFNKIKKLMLIIFDSEGQILDNIIFFGKNINNLQNKLLEIFQEYYGEKIIFLFMEIK